jgi:hypothetical protein
MFARGEVEKVDRLRFFMRRPLGAARFLLICLKQSGFAFALLSGPVQSAAGTSFCSFRLAGSF